MKLLTCPPPPSLADFVELFWLCEHDGLPHPKERLLPMGTMELVIDLKGEGRLPAMCGVHSEPFEIETGAPTAVLGVHFKPGGAFPFLKAPAGELHNARVTLDALWGRKAAEFQERVLEARSPAARIQALARALLEQATVPLARHPAVAFALNEFHSSGSAPSVGEVSDRIGLSPRRFIQLFRDEVGLTPKLYRRIHRFQQLLKRVQSPRRIDWAAAAMECGYYDQSHFINDFREFSGLNPTTYLQSRNEHDDYVPNPNHVPLVD